MGKVIQFGIWICHGGCTDVPLTAPSTHQLYLHYGLCLATFYILICNSVCVVLIIWWLLSERFMAKNSYKMSKEMIMIMNSNNDFKGIWTDFFRHFYICMKAATVALKSIRNFTGNPIEKELITT